MTNILVFVLLLHSVVFAIDGDLLPASNSVISRSITDRGIGYATNGGLENAFLNNGIFSSMSLSPSISDRNYQYGTALSFFIGLPGRDETGEMYPWAVRTHPDYPDTSLYFGPTVSESWFDRSMGLTQTDWEARDNSWGELFSGELSAGDAFSSEWTVAEDSNPLLAHSDLIETWPVVGDGPFWPGRHSLNHPVGQREIYFEFTDSPYADRDEDPSQGYPTQISVSATVSDFDNPIYEDALLIRLTLVNNSEWDYENVYSGFYFDVDSYSRQRDGQYTGRSNDDDMMAMDRETNSTFIWDYNGESNGRVNLQHVGLQFIDTPNAPYDIDFDNDGSIDVQQNEMLGLSSWRWFDWYQRPGVLRDEASGSSCPGAYAGDEGCPGAVDKEAIQYALISGDLDYPAQTFQDWEWRGLPGNTPNPMGSAYDAWYFHPDSSGYVSPYFDGPADDVMPWGEVGRDCLLMMSCGPFNFPAGDTLRFITALVLGKRDIHDSMNIPQALKGNMQRLQAFVDADYQSPAVEISAPAMHSEQMDHIDLGWNYVGLDGAIQDEWAIRLRGESGMWDDWRFGESSLPGVTLDVSDVPDYPWYSMQVMVGTHHLFAVDQIDSLIINNPGNSPPFGKITAPVLNELVSGDYSITWDLLDLEGDEATLDIYCNPLDYPRWILIESGYPNIPYVWDSSQFPNSEQLQLKIEVTDGVDSNTFYSEIFRVENDLPTLPETMIAHVQGNSNARVRAVISDPSELTGHHYTIQCFADTVGHHWGTTQLMLVDETLSQTLYSADRLQSFMQLPPFDGLSLQILGWDQVEVDTIIWNRESPEVEFFMHSSYAPPKPGEYLFVFSEMGVDTTFAAELIAPFQVFNLLENPGQALDFFYFDLNRDQHWQVGERITLRENFRHSEIDTFSRGFTWNLESQAENSGSWVAGDSILIKMNIPLQRNDSYEFNTAFASINNAGILPVGYELLAAYPNPFNASVTIPFKIAEPSQISLSIYDLRGRLVWEINAKGQGYPPGRHHVVWQGVDRAGQTVASGVYIISMRVGDHQVAEKILLLK